ncbi:hypothetical protein QTJ16_004249 [Diplocarpon rosae]|uniref:Thioredoxin domain-containing protein n=1 Tax=Diplocarpon rosae TaxID=946125 RepID=A0AAD9SZQ2_9HELO|nr:hypothetical protein QTJ16_004249 [Diplocarpon rosae]PBP17511.1 hypothetical protein BUE80_DR011266 [Diplocarpon rosae]
MPLHVSSEPASAVEAFLESSATASRPSFLVVYASRGADGQSWCGDCRDAEPVVNSKFADGEAVVKIVYAGQRDEWRSAENPWRRAPFSITNLPTLVKVAGDGRWERLVEADVANQEKLDAFVGDAQRGSR